MNISDEISPLDISACIAEKAEETLAPLKEDLVDWLNKLFDVDITVENFMEFLDNGVLVSKVAELVHRAAEEYYRAGKTKNSVPRYEFRYHKKAKSGTFFARDNVAFFLDWCRCFGVSESVLFESDGLVMHKQPREVVLCLLEVARLAADYGIEPPGIVTLEKEIDAEIANEEKEGGPEVKEEVVEVKPAKEEKALVKQSNNNVEKQLSLDKEVGIIILSFHQKVRSIQARSMLWFWDTFLLLEDLIPRGGSRGRQTGHATNIKIVNLINVLNIRPIVQLFFITQRHLITVQYLLSCSASN
jgi:hypothetical protein